MKEQKFFYGFPVSEYGAEHGHVDYATLAKAVDAFSFDGAQKLFFSYLDDEYLETEIINGTDTDEDGNYKDFFQFFAVSEYGAEILKRHTEEVVYYISALNLYIWCIDHWGTAWSYVLTDIKIESDED